MPTFNILFDVNFPSSRGPISHYEIVKVHIFEKATKFCEIFPLLLFYVVPVKSKGKILQIFLAFSEYMNFTSNCFILSSQQFEILQEV